MSNLGIYRSLMASLWEPLCSTLSTCGITFSTPSATIRSSVTTPLSYPLVPFETIHYQALPGLRNNGQGNSLARVAMHAVWEHLRTALESPVLGCPNTRTSTICV